MWLILCLAVLEGHYMHHGSQEKPIIDHGSRRNKQNLFHLLKILYSGVIAFLGVKQQKHLTKLILFIFINAKSFDYAAPINIEIFVMSSS